MPAHCITIDLPSQSVRECMHYTLKTCRILASRQPWFVGQSRDRHSVRPRCILQSGPRSGPRDLAAWQEARDWDSTTRRIARSQL